MARSAILHRMSRILRLLYDSEVLYDLSLNAINTVFLAGKASSRVPELITNLAYTSLKFVGLVYLPAQVQTSLKNCRDSVYALKNRSWVQFCYAAPQAFVQGSGVVLSLGGTVAAVATTLAGTAVTRVIYSVLCPWGLVALAVQIMLEVWCHLTDDALLVRMNGMKRDSGAIVRLFECYDSKSADADMAAFAAGLRNRMDTHTWNTLEEKAVAILRARRSNPISWMSTRWRLSKLFQVTVENITTQRNTLRADMLLRAVGYGAMAVTRAYPQTLIEAIVNWSISAFWTSRVFVTKYQQAGQQESILQA